MCVAEVELKYKRCREYRDGEYPYVLLEKIFMHFNMLEADQDQGRINYSLSVLDVLEIDRERYQVMDIGFAKLDF